MPEKLESRVMLQEISFDFLQDKEIEKVSDKIVAKKLAEIIGRLWEGHGVSIGNSVVLRKRVVYEQVVLEKALLLVG